MNKKASVFIFIVVLVVTLVSGGVIYGVTSSILKVINNEGDLKACTLSAILSSQSKVWGVELVKLSCPMRFLTIKKEDLATLGGQISREVKESARLDPERYNRAVEELEQKGIILPEAESGEVSYFPGAGRELLELGLNDIILDEVESCWTKLGEGELDLFSNWYGDDFSVDSIRKFTGLDYPPKTCVICSRIKFSQDLKDSFDQTSIETGTAWSKLRTINQQSYYHYLLDDKHDEYVFQPSWDYSIDKPLAVVFGKTKESQVSSFLTTLASVAVGFIIPRFIWAGDGDGPSDDSNKGTSFLLLIPYSAAADNCDYLANDPPEKIEKLKVFG